MRLFSRRYLPHWYKPGFAHFITYRLVDSIPTVLLQKWKAKRKGWLAKPEACPCTRRPNADSTAPPVLPAIRQSFGPKQRDELAGRRACAKVIRDNLYHHNGTKYELLAYCVMPSHVHLLLQPFHQASVGTPPAVPFFVRALPSPTKVGRRNKSPPKNPPNHSLTAIMHSLKSFTANKANLRSGSSGNANPMTIGSATWTSWSESSTTSRRMALGEAN